MNVQAPQPCYLRYFYAIFDGMKGGALTRAATPAEMTAIINWWYSRPAFLAAMAVEDSMTWAKRGRLMTAIEFDRLICARGIYTPYSAEHLLFGMRLACAMDEREQSAQYLMKLLNELENGKE